MRFLLSKPAQKFYVLALWGIVGAAARAGLLPEAVGGFLSEHSLEAVFLALGLGHVMPEAAK